MTCSSAAQDGASGPPHSKAEPLPIVELDGSHHAVTVLGTQAAKGPQSSERAWANNRVPADMDLAPGPTLEPLQEVPVTDTAAEGNLVLQKVDDTASQSVTVPMPNLDVWQPYMGNNDAVVPQATASSGDTTPSSNNEQGSKQMLLKGSVRTPANTHADDDAVAPVPEVVHQTVVPPPIATGTYGGYSGNHGGYGGCGGPGSYGYSGEGHASYQGTKTGNATVLQLDIPGETKSLETR